MQQFVLYDISAGYALRTKLATVAVPHGAHGFVQGIPGTTPPLVFELGQHKLAIRAQDPNGLESHIHGCISCTTWVEVP